jgi:ABC-type dipeptide/oligopeptide/nickel transport system permease component
VARYLAKRILFIIVAFIVISFVTFILMKVAPGSFLDMTGANMGQSNIGANTGLTEAQIQWFVKEFHLDAPWYMQYWGYVWGFVTLHLGSSFEYAPLPTMFLLKKAFPLTLGVAVAAIIVATLFGIVLGIGAAMRKNTWADRSAMLVAVCGTAIPHYVVAIVLMLIFGVWLRILPVVGTGSVKDFILPVLSLALPLCGFISRYMRNSLIETLNSEYMVTVYAKGGTLKNALFGHGLRNSLLPFITVIGPQLAGLMMGTVYIETMFSYLGVGKIFTGATVYKDYPLIMDSALMFAVFILIMNLLVDLSYGFLDPRIRKSEYAGR